MNRTMSHYMRFFFLKAYLRKKQEQMKADKLARERELAKVPIKKEDVELIMTEMEIPEDRAVRTLREHGGNVVLALTALVNAPF